MKLDKFKLLSCISDRRNSVAACQVGDDRGLAQSLIKEEKRLCPRVRYKAGSTAVVQIGEQTFTVVDMSKTGVSFVVDSDSHEPFGIHPILGSIRIPDGTCVRFRGAAVRQLDGVAAIQFMHTEYSLD